MSKMTHEHRRTPSVPFTPRGFCSVVEGWTKPQASYLLCLPSNHLLMQCTITPAMTDISKVTKWLMSTPPFCTNLGVVTKIF